MTVLLWILLTLSIHRSRFMSLLSHKLQGNLTWRPPLFPSHSFACSTSCLQRDPGYDWPSLIISHLGLPRSAPERQVQPIIRSESHTGDILSNVYQILWTGMAAGETYCATLPLIFCQVIPGWCEWCEAAGRETVLQFEDLCWQAAMLLKCLWAELWISANSGGFVWLLTLLSDLKRRFTAPTGVKKAPATQKNSSMVGIHGASQEAISFGGVEGWIISKLGIDAKRGYIVVNPGDES